MLGHFQCLDYLKYTTFQKNKYVHIGEKLVFFAIFGSLCKIQSVLTIMLVDITLESYQNTVHICWIQMP